MFTGIVEEVGKIKNIQKKGVSAVLTVECAKVLDGTVIGDSIAVNGVCLTVVDLKDKTFSADISYETLNKSALGFLKAGDFVNLERALTLSSRLGGHLMQGHVDGIGTIVGIEKKGESYLLSIEYPASLDKYIAEKGSVSIDGISLTVAENKGVRIGIAVIPHTFESTNLRVKKVGDKVNLEVDIIARYLEKLLKKEEKESKLYEALKHFSELEEF